MNGFGGGGFGAAAGGGGGGYGSQAPGGFSQTNSSQDGGQQRQRVDHETSLVSLTVKQLASAPSGADPNKVELDGRELTQVQLVGQIRSVNKQSTNTQYVIDDSTGVIEVKRWGESADNFTQNQYVRVVGRINIYQEKRSINAFKVFAITDFNEVTCHFLQVIEAHIYATKGAGAQTAQAGGQMQTNFGQQAVAAPVQQQTMPAVGQPQAFDVSGGGDGLTPEQQRLLAAIKAIDAETGKQEEGVHIDLVIKRMDPSGNTANQIKEVINFLAEEGHLYSTTDEEHFKATD